MPIEINEQQNVFKEKAEDKVARVENEKRRAEQKEREAKEEVERLTHMALHDELTGLKNRAAFEKDIKELSSKELCCISVDANNLKKINDSMGHKYGDVLLKSIGDSLKEIFGDNTYRVGGDEYIVLVQGEGKKVIEHKIEAVQSLLKEEEKKLDEDFEMSIAVGMAFSDGSNSIDEIMEEADMEMYKNKKEYKQETKVHAPKSDEVYEPNFDGYYNDVKAEYEAAVKDNKKDTVKTAVKVGVIAVVAIIAWIVIFNVLL